VVNLASAAEVSHGLCPKVLKSGAFLKYSRFIPVQGKILSAGHVELPQSVRHGLDSKVNPTTRERGYAGVHRPTPKQNFTPYLLLPPVIQPRTLLSVRPTAHSQIRVPTGSSRSTMGITSISNHCQWMPECGHTRFLSIFKTECQSRDKAANYQNVSE
jgi:hypothetical protein